MAMPRSIEVVPGMKFGELTSISEQYRVKEKENKLYCMFKCSCGVVKEIRARHVTAGLQKSCGCVRPNRLEKGEASFNSLCYEYEYHAKNRGIDFFLTREDIRQLTKKNCVYCGSKPDRLHTRHWRKGEKSSPYVCNGIDRVDNNSGYTLQNCVPCCKICNVAKRSMSLEEFLAWIDRLVKFRTQQNTESPAIVQGNESNL